MGKAEEDVNRFLQQIPEYDPEEWEEYIEAGCYPYALNKKINQYILIGDFIGKPCTHSTSAEVLIKTLKEELKIIMDYEVEEVDVKFRAKRGEKKIYLHRFNTGHYHLYREDSNGLWSHKCPRELPTQQEVLSGDIIDNPESLNEIPFTGWCLLLKRKESV